MTHNHELGRPPRPAPRRQPQRCATLRAGALLAQFTAAWLAACSGDGALTPPPGGPDASGSPANAAVISSVQRRVDITWDTVPGASTYNVYRRTTPGVTPSNGKKITVSRPVMSEGRIAFADTVDAPGTYFYVVTAMGPTGESGASGEVQADVSDLIGFTVDFPVPGTIVLDSVTVRAFPQSTFEIGSVTAEVDGRVANLQNEFLSPGRFAWVGHLNLTGLAPGRKNVTVTLRDVRGNQVQTVIPVQFNLPAVIAVQAPLPYTVARPTLQVTATCTVGSAPCRLLEFNTGGTTLASSTNGSINTTADLSRFAGTQVQLRFDGYTTTDAHTRLDLPPVYVETSPALTEYATVPGRVLDVQTGRVLWLDSTSAAITPTIRDVASGTDTPLLTAADALIGPARLTPTGAVFGTVAPGSSLSPGAIYEWRNGVRTTLATGVGAPYLAAAGDFALSTFGSGQTTLSLRDVVAGTSTTLASDVNSNAFDVAANGDAVYRSQNGNQIIRVRNASASTIATTAGMFGAVLTDGTNVVFVEGPALFGDTVAFRLIGPSGLTTLTTRGPNGAAEFLVNNGWTAYRQFGPSDQPQVWSRAPDDTRRQVTFFSGGSKLEALGPTGELVYTAPSNTPEETRLLNSPPYASNGTSIGSALLGRPLYVGTALYVLIGRSVFTVHP